MKLKLLLRKAETRLGFVLYISKWLAVRGGVLPGRLAVRGGVLPGSSFLF